MEKQEVIEFLSSIKPDLQKEGIDKLGLFGSYSKESANEFSDIDIAFKLQKDFLEKNDVWKYFELTKKISDLVSRKFNKKSEVFDLDSASSLKDLIQKETIYV